MTLQARKFKDYGYLLGLKQQFQTPQLVRFFGEEYVGYLDEQEGFYLLRNNCPHRESKLHSEQVRGTCIHCPYHGLALDEKNGYTPQEVVTKAVGSALFGGFEECRVDPELINFSRTPN